MKARYRAPTSLVKAKKAAHPGTAPSLYAQAESAASAVFQSACALNASPRRFMKAMDNAAATVFTAGGVPHELAAFYAMSVTADVLERESVRARFEPALVKPKK